MAKSKTIGQKINSTPTTVSRIHKNHNGKISDKWSSYLSEYDKILSPKRNSIKRILEIGVQNGGSLEIWGKYFKNATHIIGCDINNDCSKLEFSDPRIFLVIGDINLETTHTKIKEASPCFDLIIDDGAHESGAIIKSLSMYFNLLSDGGMYIIEDLHCSYYSAHNGGLFNTASSINFLKSLIDVVNQEHWSNRQNDVPELLNNFSISYGINFSREDLSKIHSIEFSNSLCVIHKKNKFNNILGPRSVVGIQATVCDQVRLLNGTSISTAPPHPIEENIRKKTIELCGVGFVNQPNSLRSLSQADNRYAQLFIDTGNGFSEEQSEISPINPHLESGVYTFNLKPFHGIVQLRLDPINEAAILIIEYIRITFDSNKILDLKINQANCTNLIGDLLFFDHNDPQVTIPLTNNPEHSPTQINIKINFAAIGNLAHEICVKSNNIYNGTLGD